MVDKMHFDRCVFKPGMLRGLLQNACFEIAVRFWR